MASTKGSERKLGKSSRKYLQAKTAQLNNTLSALPKIPQPMAMYRQEFEDKARRVGISQ